MQYPVPGSRMKISKGYIHLSWLQASLHYSFIKLFSFVDVMPVTRFMCIISCAVCSFILTAKNNLLNCIPYTLNKNFK